VGVVLLVALVMLTPGGAAARSARVSLVVAEIAGPAPALDDALLGALQGPLRELDVEVVVVHARQTGLAGAARRARAIARSERAMGVIWLEARSDGLAVFLYDSTREHLYVRSLEADGSAASQSEAAAIILRSAISAMLEGNSVSMTEIELPPAAPTPSATPERAASTAPSSVQDEAYLRVGVGYVGTLFARRTDWQHGASITIFAAAPGSPWFVGLGYTQFPAVELEGNGATTRLQRHPAEALVGFRLPLSSLRLAVAGAVVGDYVVRSTERTADGLVATAPSGRWLWALSTRLGVVVPASRSISGVVNVGAEFLLNPFHQVVSQTNAGNQLVGAPLLARPRLELGITISLW
jgi:hypothetical protein